MSPLLLLALGALSSAHAQISRTALDFASLAPASGEWSRLALPDDLAAAEPALLRGERGLALAPGEHGDFSATVRLRFDDLRFQIRLPQAGLAFAAQGRRDHAAVVLERLTGRLQLLRVVANRPAVLAVSERRALLPLHQWVWLRVERRGPSLTAALSLDGLAFDELLRAELPADLGRGRLGLVGDLPAATFAPAHPPALVVRDLGEWTQDAAGAVSARYSAERFSPATGLVREPISLQFSPGQSDAALPGGVRAPNPALALPVPAFAPAPAHPSAAPAELRVTFDRVVASLGRRDGYIRLGTADAYDATRAPALRDQLAADASALLRDFAADGLTPAGFSELYAAFRVLASARRDALLPADELARIPDFARRALVRADYERGPMNRAIGLLAALGPGLALAGEHPRAAELAEVARRVEADLAAHAFEPLEDSTNYQLISLYFTLCWARDADRAAVLADPRFRAVFARLLAQLGPDGTIPAYGDDHASHPGVLVGLFAAAARHFNEPRYAAAAALVHSRHFTGPALPPGLVGEDALGLGLALAAAPDLSLPPHAADPAPLAAILRRADGSPDKAVLSAGTGPAALHLVLDLANGREHGHHDALALVGLVSGATPLLTDAGRYSRVAWTHNRPQVAAAPEDFPRPRAIGEQSRRMLDDGLAPGVWHRLSFAPRDHWIWGNYAGALGLPALERGQYHPDIGPEFAYDPARQSALLLALAGTGPVRVETRAARFTGPAGELPAPPLSAELELGADVAYRGAVLPAPLDLKRPDHDRLDLELRLTPLAPHARVALNSLVIGDADGYPKRLLTADSPAERVTVLFAENSAALAAAGFAAETRAPDGQPLRLERVVTVLPGRGVWVRDRFVHLGNTPDSAPLTVGPAWQFSAARLAPDGWLHAPGLRVGFAPAPEAAITLSHLRRYGLETPLSFALGGPLAPGAVAVRDTFLVPASAAPASWSVAADTLLLDGRPAAILRMKNSAPVSVEAVAP